MLFEYQRDIVRWALIRGRACIWADCGLGKTPMQLEWASHVPGRVLLFAPLAVSQQTIREGAKFGHSVAYARCQSDADAMLEKLIITNYEMIEHFEADKWGGIVLDESSIIKSHDGATRDIILSKFCRVPFRLACTATPAPNDYMEIGNHAEFVGSMTREEMLAMFFVHDGGETQKWRLKGHAKSDFWKWLCSWAVMIRKPSDLGYSDDGFTLPPLAYHEHVIHAESAADDMLIPLPAATLQERIGARRATVDARVKKCAELVNGTDGQWLVWCNLNSESESLASAINGAVEVSGSDSNEHKEKSLMAFAAGEIRVLISKPRIAGWGMNFQSCHNMAFVGLSDSWESYYQAVRRCWRFGQKQSVNVHVITADIEGAVVSNIKRKEKDAENMANEMLEHMKDINTAELHGMTSRQTSGYVRKVKSGKGWTMHLADCVDLVKEQPDNSLHFSVFSPPFSSLYIYSNSDRDMGNSKDDGEFMRHFGYMVKELYRAMMPGRLVSFHCMNLPTSKQNHGYIGIRDFRGELIRLFESFGFIFHSEVCIWKDPVTAMQRTKALGLLWKQIKKDSCMSRQGIPDYLVTMRKPGDNPERVEHTAEDFPVQLWQRYASPVWMDINPSDTLQKESAREENDERHICPLQLEVIRRALKLWSNPGDVVFSPFGGIASEGVVAIQEGRKFLGSELKESYWKQACANLEIAEHDAADGHLFSMEPQ
jgi:superfamily II DNA or RNA helicase